MEFLNRHRVVIKKIWIIVAIFIGIYIFANYIFGYIAPFFFGYIFAMMLEPFVGLLNKKVKLPRWIASLLGVVMLILILGFIGSAIVTKIIKESIEFKDSLPSTIQSVTLVVNQVNEKLNEITNSLPQSLKESVNNSTKYVISFVTTTLGSGVKKNSLKIPGMLLFFVVTILSTFFISKDKKKIDSFLLKQVPSKWIYYIELIKVGVLDGLLGYVKAQLILMSIVATICITGLTIMRYPYSFFVGVGISVIDAIPVFGSGAVLWPWAIYSIATGNARNAIGLAVIYITVLITRQVLEPKVLGKQIGVYPLVTLMSIYIGLKIFGVLGVLLGPMTVIIIKRLQESSILPSFKK